MELNDKVRAYWEERPCGAEATVVKEAEPGTVEWYERIEEYRYRTEPCIFAVAQFTRHRGAKVLEIGVGAGTDHLQWARAGADLYGVDATDAAVEMSRHRLSLNGFTPRIERVNAETLPFDDETFDIVYSWGVIHHSDSPEKIVAEIHRVLKPGGQFIGMVYNRHSILTYRFWLRFALLAGRPWRSLADVVWNHMESIGTKAYTNREVERLLSPLSTTMLENYKTVGDTHRLPTWVARWIPERLGWFTGFRATKSIGN